MILTRFGWISDQLLVGRMSVAAPQIDHFRFSIPHSPFSRRSVESGVSKILLSLWVKGLCQAKNLNLLSFLNISRQELSALSHKSGMSGVAYERNITQFRIRFKPSG